MSSIVTLSDWLTRGCSLPLPISAKLAKSILSLFVRNATSRSVEGASEGRSILCHNAFIDYFKNRASENDIERFYLHYYYDTDAEFHGAMPIEINYY